MHSDPRLLERILRNLLANALAYTPRGRVLLGCRRAGASLRIQVLDTGIGIPPDQQAAVFEEFYQLGNPARDRRKGLGLGLAIVDRLARLLGHRIGVRSVPGRGTMFEVHVPLAAGGDRPERCGAPAPPLTPAPPPAGGRLVALIEDDQQLSDALGLFLLDLGHEVVAAPEADEMLRRLREEHRRSPDIILADYRLQGGATGTEAIRRLRDAFGREIPSLLLTGDTSPDRLKEANESGFSMLHKPVGPDDLMRALDALDWGGPH